MKPGDLLLICSDGLTEALSDQEIGAIIGRCRTGLASIADALVAAANAKGGPDNISVVIVEPIPPAAAETLLLPSLPA
jgi:protein phosphatase